MKEKITYYKGTNPLVALPAFAACTAHLVLVIKFFIYNDAPENPWGFLATMFNFLISCCLLFGPVFLLGCVSENDEPTVAYVGKRLVRGIVSLAIALGVGALMVITAAIKNPEFKNFLDSALLATSVISLILLLTQIAVSVFNETTSKLKPERSTPNLGLFRVPFLGLYACLILFLWRHHKLDAETGEACFAIFTLSGIAFLWFEDHKKSIADREIIPLCTTSILWIGSGLLAHFAYANLASLTFVLPYLIYLLPLILLGFYYYVTAPVED